MNDIRHDEQPGGGAFVIEHEGRRVGELTYRLRDGVADFNHTWTLPEMRGGGLAARLVAAGIAEARARGWRVVPSCSYVAASFRRHPEWADLLA